MNDFDRKLKELKGDLIRTRSLATLQVNICLACNHHCSHCHQDAGPERKEVMNWAVMKQVMALAKTVGPKVVDITGGAPERNPELRRFVTALRENGHPVMVRTNLTILQEPGMKGMMEFYRDSGVKLIASLPCYEAAEVDSVRGRGVFDRSIRSLQQLNELGFGKDKAHVIDLVFNPEKDFLPPPQAALEKDFKRILKKDFGIVFNGLIAIANMPVGRFKDWLKARNAWDSYNELLRSSFNPATVDNLMCLDQIDVGWDGTIYDCDFNMAANLPVGHGTPTNIRDFDPARHTRRRIVTADHCFGCTAGAGSSCGGALQK